MEKNIKSPEVCLVLIKKNSVKSTANGTALCTRNTVIRKRQKFSSTRKRRTSLKKSFGRFVTKENSKADGKKTRKLLRFSFLSFGSSKNEKNFRFSSRLWKDVTFYLKSKQIDKATESKSFLEQRQREAAKERAEKSLKWQTKVRQKEKFLVERKNFLFRLRILRNPVNFVGLTIKS